MSKLRELEKRLEKEPENLGLRVAVAGAMREAGRQAEAVELYRSVAIAYRDQGRSQQAIAVCRSILEIAPDDTRCHALLASLVAHHKGTLARDAANPYGDDIVLEVKTPPPPPEARVKSPTAPPAAGTGVQLPRTATPLRATGSQATRPPTAPPAIARAGLSVPLPKRDTPLPRRSSFDGETPLPQPLPYHVADPTTRGLKKLSEVDLLPTPDPDDLAVSDDAQTRPGPSTPSVKGIANAARRISGALTGSLTASTAASEDLASELDTRQRPRIESDELEKIARPPPTVPVERLDVLGDDEDAVTTPPAAPRTTDDDTDQEEPDDGVPTLADDDHDEVTRPRDTALDHMIRTESEGPLGTAFFQPLPSERRDGVLARFHRKRVTKGTTVIRQGEVGHALVVIVRGQLQVRANGIDVRQVGTGEYIGEGSLLARAPSPVHVVATIDSELLVLPPRAFYEVAGAFPALWAELKDVAERRKRELEATLRRVSP